MAQSAIGEPVIIACFYNADSKLNIKELVRVLPKDDGESLIQLPHSLTAKAARKNVDVLDSLSLEDPYQKAANLLNLGLGQINPLSIVMRAQELGVKLICVYDERLAGWNKPLTNNAGSRVLGTYVPNGVGYIELAIAHAQNVELAGTECKGYNVSNIAEREKDLQTSSAIRAVYAAADSFEEAMRAAMKGGSQYER